MTFASLIGQEVIVACRLRNGKDQDVLGILRDIDFGAVLVEVNGFWTVIFNATAMFPAEAEDLAQKKRGHR